MSELNDAYEQLFQAYGPQHWWPGDSPFEIIIGAILTQNTNWKNVERALKQLREAELLSVSSLRKTSVEELAELIRPAGYYRQKAKRLHNFLHFLDERYDGSLELLFDNSVDELRMELLSINGIGPETADSIVLYAANMPTFVIDAYTARVFVRHGWIDADARYDDLKQYAESQLPQDTQLFNEFHALIVQVGKKHCRKKPDCENCPLSSMLPAAGPYQDF